MKHKALPTLAALLICAALLVPTSAANAQSQPSQQAAAWAGMLPPADGTQPVASSSAVQPADDTLLAQAPPPLPPPPPAPPAPPVPPTPPSPPSPAPVPPAPPAPPAPSPMPPSRPWHPGPAPMPPAAFPPPPPPPPAPLPPPPIPDPYQHTYPYTYPRDYSYNYPYGCSDWNVWPCCDSCRWYVNSRPVTQVVVVQEPACAPIECSVPVISSLSSTPDSIQQFNSSTLSWMVNNATSVSIYPSVGAVNASGSYVVSPAATTTYTLTASNNYGSVTASTTVTVIPPVTTTYNSNPYNSTSTYSTASSPAQSAPAETGVVTSGPSSSSNPFSNLWLTSLLLLGLIAIATVVTVLIITGRHAPTPAAAAAGTVAASRSTAVATMPATGTATRTSSISPALQAKFVSDMGDSILLPGNGLLGRNDFQSVLTSDRSDLISRQHLRVDYENGQYYIEDSASTNGTKLNGKDIRSTGRQAINNGDLVDLAGVISLTFKT